MIGPPPSHPRPSSIAPADPRPDTCTELTVDVDSTTGACARCQQPCERYGDHGAPLCGDCQPPSHATTQPASGAR
jgi:hypothetical protein